MTDWFEKITGFRELSYVETQAKLWEADGLLCSTDSDQRFAIGMLETPSLFDLRERVATSKGQSGRSRVRCIEGDARKLHTDPEYRGALFQVASQFNLLEMVGPSITPEHGVTRYADDRTQGPACAIAAGAGTIYRNYLVPMAVGRGQSADRQLDCLADLGAALGNTGSSLWAMQNGYALCSEAGLTRIDALLERLEPRDLDALRGLLRIGLQWNVEVTDAAPSRQVVSQAYCSALPIAYTRIKRERWRRFASLVLEAAYEATLLAAVLNVQHGGTSQVLLTRVGGGAFGNDFAWINSAIERAINLLENAGLDVSIVSFNGIPDDIRRLCR